MEQVFRWIIAGHTEHDIIDAIKATWPKRNPTKLIGDAMMKIANAGQVEPEILRGWAFEAYREIYRRMLEVGDYAGALAAVKEIARLPALKKSKRES